MSQLASLVQSSKAVFDLAEPDHQESLFRLADSLMADHSISPTEIQSAARQPSAPLEFKIAAKLADSRSFLLSNDKPVKIGIVFAMWGEQNRLKPKSATDPHGEDSLRSKIRQLDWVTTGTKVSWKLYPVDDGCPHGSGRLAQEIAAEYADGHAIQVLHLADRLPAKEGPLSGLASADDSRKAGAIICGSHQAIADGGPAVRYQYVRRSNLLL